MYVCIRDKELSTHEDGVEVVGVSVRIWFVDRQRHAVGEYRH